MELWVQVVGLIVQTGLILGGVLLAIGGAKNQLQNLDKRVEKLETGFVQLAVQSERMNAMDQRMLAQGRRLDRMEYARRKTSEENPDN